MEPFLIVIGVVGSIISGLIISVFRRYLRRKDDDIKTAREHSRSLKKEIDTMKLAIEDNNNNIWKIRKTTLIIAKILDDQTAKNHPELTNSLEDIANELLNQSDKKE